MTNQIKLTSEFPFVASNAEPLAFAYLGPNDMKVTVEATTRDTARNVGLDIGKAWELGFPAAQTIMAKHINDANARQEPLAVTLEQVMEQPSTWDGFLMTAPMNAFL